MSGESKGSKLVSITEHFAEVKQQSGGKEEEKAERRMQDQLQKQKVNQQVKSFTSSSRLLTGNDSTGKLSSKLKKSSSSEEHDIHLEVSESSSEEKITFWTNPFTFVAQNRAASFYGRHACNLVNVIVRQAPSVFVPTAIRQVLLPALLLS